MNKIIINRTNKKTSLIELKRYFELLYIFSILTIILALFALNRMCYGILNQGVCFGSGHYFIRNIIEHFFTGLYIPIFSLFIFYTGVLITAKLSSQSFRFNKNKELFVAGFGSILYLALEMYFQFWLKYNSSSAYQFFVELIGIGICIYYLIRKIK